MKKLVTFACVVALAASAPAWAGLLLYDGFDYTAGEPLENQVNTAYGEAWGHGGTTVAPTVANGSLAAPAGLPAEVGNSVAMIGRPATTTANDADRINIPGAPSSGTLYWSGLIHVDQIDTLCPSSYLSGLLIGGFNNRTSSETANVSTAGALLLIRKTADGAHWNVGTGATTVNTDRVIPGGGALDLNPGDTAFVVASYTWIDGAANDLVKLWVNPDAASFGAMTEPTETASVVAAHAASEQLRPDQGGAASFFVRNNSSTVGAAGVMQFDELRIGDTWTSVTPEPSSVLLILVGFAGLGLRRRSA